MHDAGCATIFSGKASGATIDRAGLADALAHSRASYVLVVWKLDRLGRTMKGLVDLAAKLADHKIGLRSFTDGIGTAGKLVFRMIAAMAKMERDIILERTKATLIFTDSEGRVGGGKIVMTPERLTAARKLLASDMKGRKIGAAIGVSVKIINHHLPELTQKWRKSIPRSNSRPSTFLNDSRKRT